jgi:hypothetical protein
VLIHKNGQLLSIDVEKGHLGRRTKIDRWHTPAEMMAKEMKTPTTPKSIIAAKFRKNCFFLT